VDWRLKVGVEGTVHAGPVHVVRVIVTYMAQEWVCKYVIKRKKVGIEDGRL
jgi:hypothetical protein